MKERPILMSAPMVRAILDGSKTQTRRAIKPQPTIDNSGNFIWNGWNFGQEIGGKPRSDALASPLPSGATGKVLCPYGKPGDQLWVRETHAQVFERDIPEGRPRGPLGTFGSPSKPDWKSRYIYRADGEMPNVQWQFVGDSSPVRWWPSIHMPRAGSRIQLEIVSVRVERLNDISEADAKAEGMKFTDYGLTCFHQGVPQDVGACPAPASSHQSRPGWHYDKSDHQDQCYGTAKYAFSALWQKINGADSWSANPWVWVVEFKRI